MMRGRSVPRINCTHRLSIDAWMPALVNVPYAAIVAQKGQVEREMPPTVLVGVSATSNCKPPISLPPEPVPSEYIEVATTLFMVCSAFCTREATRLIDRSLPEF